MTKRTRAPRQSRRADREAARVLASPTDRVVRADLLNAENAKIELEGTSAPSQVVDGRDDGVMTLSSDGVISKLSTRLNDFFSERSAVGSADMRASTGIDPKDGFRPDRNVGHNAHILNSADMVRDMDVKKPVNAEGEYLKLREEIAELRRLIAEKNARVRAAQQLPDEGRSTPLQSALEPQDL